jgi:hypothetical protein
MTRIRSGISNPLYTATIAGLCAVMILAPTRAAAQAGLAATLLKALPSIESVFKDLFKPNTDASPTKQQNDKKTDIEKDANSSMKDVGTYAKREQILSKVVDASGKASISMTELDYVFSQQKPTESQITVLGTQQWQDVKTALAAIAAAAPDSSA